MNRDTKLRIYILKSVLIFIDEVVVKEDIWEISELVEYIKKQIQMYEKSNNQINNRV